MIQIICINSYINELTDSDRFYDICKRCNHIK